MEECHRWMYSHCKAVRSAWWRNLAEKPQNIKLAIGTDGMAFALNDGAKGWVGDDIAVGFQILQNDV